MNPNTRLAEPTVAVMAPATSKRPCWRSVSATNLRTSRSTTRPRGMLMNSDQRHEANPVSVPPISRPREAPAEDTALNSASALVRAAASGADVVSSASTLGAATAAPTPWRARAATRRPEVGASPPRSEPRVNTASPAMNVRRRPKTSPRRPPRRSSPPNASV
jgi:hypothetical protein